MIILDVLESHNPFLLGPHKNYGNMISIGKAKRHNISDSNLEVFNLNVANDKLYIENKKKNVFYKINGKKISGKKSLSIGDQFSYLDFHFKVVDFQYSHIDPITDTESLYSKRVEECPELESIFSHIEQEFIHLERIKYNEE